MYQKGSYLLYIANKMNNIERITYSSSNSYQSSLKFHIHNHINRY